MTGIGKFVCAGLAVMACLRASATDVVVFAEQGDAVRFVVKDGVWKNMGTWLRCGEGCVQPVCGAFAGGVVYVADRVRSGDESEGRILKYSPEGKLLGAFKPKLDFFPSCMAVSPDGEWLYVACGFNRHANTLWRWRISDGAGGQCPVPEFEVVRAMAFGADGMLYASCRGMSAVRVFDVADGVTLKGTILSSGASTGGLVMDAARGRLVLPGRNCEVIDLATGRRTKRADAGCGNALGGGVVDGTAYVVDRGYGNVKAIGDKGAFRAVAAVPNAIGFAALSAPAALPRLAKQYAYSQMFKSPEDDFRPMPYNNPKARPFLKGGLCCWPMPIDMNGDGRLDIVLQSWCVTPFAGTFVAENASGNGGETLFRPLRKIAPYGYGGLSCVRVGGQSLVTSAGGFSRDFAQTAFKGLRPWKDLPWNVHWDNIGRNVWRLADLDCDGRLDLIVGVSDTREYGWGNFYEPRGNYKNARPHGYLWWIRNEGEGGGLPGDGGTEKWGEPKLIRTENHFPAEALGHVFPMARDWDGDGDVDILCSDASGTISYFENVGTKTEPVFTGETFPREANGKRLDTYLNQTAAATVDFDGDGVMDFILAEEDGRVAFVRGTGHIDERRAPVFEQPVYLHQEPEYLNFSSLPTPCAVDWDGDGDLDLIAGEAGGSIAFIENLSGSGVDEPSWAEPRLLSCEPLIESPFGAERHFPFDFKVFQNDPIRIQAGPNGSMLGPVEAKYGYTTLTVSDWDGDGLPDVMASSIWGKPLIFRNIGTRTRPRLAAPTGVEVAWKGAQPSVPWGWFHPDRERNPKELISQWRTTPCMVDLDNDGLMDLVMMDNEGFFAFFRRERRQDGTLVLQAPERLVCFEDGTPIKITYGNFGAGGRRKFCFCDWDGDGVLDMIVNGVNADFFKGLGRGVDGKWRFRNEGPMGLIRLAGHTTSPTPADFDGDGRPDIVLGAEDGFFYRFRNRRGRE